MKTSRHSFVLGSLGMCVAGIVNAACGGDDAGDDGNTGGSGGGGGGGACTTTIGTNHGHMMTVSAADKMAAVDKTYDIAGGAGHSHTVEITAEEFADLAGGSELEVTSSTDAGHSHVVTIKC
jgi:hypothetical protein